MAMKAASQLHWCGYSEPDGTVEWPRQLASSTARARRTSSSRSRSDGTRPRRRP